MAQLPALTVWPPAAAFSSPRYHPELSDEATISDGICQTNYAKGAGDKDKAEGRQSSGNCKVEDDHESCADLRSATRRRVDPNPILSCIPVYAWDQKVWKTSQNVEVAQDRNSRSNDLSLLFCQAGTACEAVGAPVFAADAMVDEK